MSTKAKTKAHDRAQAAIKGGNCNTCKHWMPEHYADERARCSVMPGEEFSLHTHYDYSCKRFEARG
jgi:hypothetical protein